MQLRGTENVFLLASLNRHSENVVVEAIIVPELELCNVKMQVLPADVVESADNPALEDAPEAFNHPLRDQVKTTVPSSPWSRDG